MNDQKNFNQPQGNRRWVWVAVIGLWVMGCLILAVGGGWWFGQRSADTRQDEAIAVATEPTVATQIVLSTPESESTDTPTPTDTPAPQPTGTPTATSGPSLGDRISLPTATSTPIPEGVIVFLSTRDYDPQSNTGNRKDDLYAMNLDGSNQIRIITDNNLGFFGWYPYYKQNQIVSIDSVGDAKTAVGTIYDITQLNHLEPLSPFGAGLQPMAPSWSKTGDIIFVYFLQDESWVIGYLGHNQTEAKQLTYPPDNDVNSAWGDNWPVWSPDGEWIAFSRNWYSDNDGIWLIRPDGSDLHQIIAMKTRIIAWSPDGTKIAFQGRAYATGLDIWVADADGSNQKQLSFFPVDDYGTYDFNLAWSPDSKRIIFHIGDIHASNKGQLYIVDADGGSEPRQLTFEGEYNGAPIWLPISMDEILANAPTPAPPTATPKPVAVAPPPAPSSCPAEGAQISLPRTGTRFNTRYNYIIGTANINRFHHWKLEYSTNPDGGWQYLLERDYAVNNDKLAMIDAKTIPRGPYGLRLTVVDETGNYPEPCVVWFTNGY